jgi:hypothetical protein
MSHGEAELVGEEEQRPARSKGLIAWSVLLFVAFLIYEITARPAFGIVILCSKFGWDTFLTGYWLWRIDPNRSRGMTFFWFHAALALIRILYVGFLLFILLSFVSAQAAAFQQAGFAREAIMALGVAAVGIILFVVAVLLGFWSAFRAPFKIWLAYPSFYGSKYQKANFAEMLMVVMVLIVEAGLNLLYLVPVMLFKPAPGIAGVIILFGWLIFNLVIAIPLIKFFRLLKKRFVAQQPSDCWEPDSVGELMVSPMPNWKRWRRLAAIPRSPN